MVLQNLLRKKYAILVLFYSVRFLEILSGPCGSFQVFLLNEIQ